MPRMKRVPVLIDADIYEMFKKSAGVSGAPVTRVINNALHEFHTKVGISRNEAVQLAYATGEACFKAEVTDADPEVKDAVGHAHTLASARLAAAASA